MNIADALDQARALAVHTLTDTVTITRQTGATTDSLGTETPTTITVWAGPGLVQRDATQPGTAMSGGQQADVSAYAVKLPVGCPVVDGDWVTVTASLTARHVGHRWRIGPVPTQGWAVLLRCPADAAGGVLP